MVPSLEELIGSLGVGEGVGFAQGEVGTSVGVRPPDPLQHCLRQLAGAERVAAKQLCSLMDGETVGVHNSLSTIHGQ